MRKFVQVSDLTLDLSFYFPQLYKPPNFRAALTTELSDLVIDCVNQQTTTKIGRKFHERQGFRRSHP